ncbi:cGMP-inhibited 3',5'-cyclic phosphodiesterase 3A-like isoform X1 [Liolophura sinensis]|uniref:cGMP-inhibited 3',5'-cyclic phosphodiesterase 3A-like isoform X1 n=1 Tax=Liolophura sinensis TaxID=3198878 RepID=UPI003158E432
MAQPRSSVSRRGSKNDADKDDEDTENNGYVQIFVKPLEQGSCNLILNWLGVGSVNFTSQQVGALYGLGAVVSCVCVYQLLRWDLALLFQKICSLVVPTFSIVCAFYWLSLYFRKTWSTTSIYLLFSSCYVGETVSRLFVSPPAVSELSASLNSEPVDRTFDPSTNYVLQPIVLFILLFVVSIASLFSSLETAHSAIVILLVSVSRFLACTTLTVLPQGLRPYVAYSCGFLGILVFKYMETVLRPPINNFMTQDGKIPVIKRRRSSSSSAHGFSHRSARRTSLPALIQKSQLCIYCDDVCTYSCASTLMMICVHTAVHLL